MTLEAGRSGAALLEAAGTLPRRPAITRPEKHRRLRLILEIGAIFLLAPLLMRYAIFTWHIPLFIVLQPVLIGFIAYLLWDRTFELRRELSVGISRAALLSILGLFTVVAAVITLWVKLEIEHRFMALPQNAPRLWLTIMIFYPLLSVIPQELVYRTFFFHRYGPLFADARWLAILVNGCLFGFAHVIFDSYVSILLTTFLGWLVAWRYDVTKSFWSVWLEHSLYGCLVFTVGLGHYFFTGISRLP